MSDDLTPENTDDVPDGAPEWAKALRKDVERLKRENSELSKENNTLKRDKVFDEAGIPTDKAGALLRKSYEGELDVEAIKAQALEYGVIEPTVPQPSAPPEELEAHARASATTGVTDPSPDLLAKIDAAGSKEELDALLANVQG